MVSGIERRASGFDRFAWVLVLANAVNGVVAVVRGVWFTAIWSLLGLALAFGILWSRRQQRARMGSE
jgi:hypothetical protein